MPNMKGLAMQHKRYDRPLRKLTALFALSLLAAPLCCGANRLSLTSRGPADTAIEDGLAWLAAQQDPETGAWSNPRFPALTALPLWAFAIENDPAHARLRDQAVAFLQRCVQPDGGIYQTVPGRKGGGLGLYNTAICMTALHALGRADLRDIILDARRYLAGSQHFGDDVYAGGFGYDRATQRAYTDLMNTHYAMEAMRRTQALEEFREGQRIDIDWDAALAYVTSLQNPADTGEDAGGFFYNPDDPKAGIRELEDRIVLRAYGSITYAGLLAMVYARVDQTDPRVISALDWAVRHWRLDENPGMGQQGLFYFFNVIARALEAGGLDRLPREPDAGGPIVWADELVNVIVSHQRPEGYWVNPEGRFWENDPVLTTAYAVLALQHARGAPF